MQEAVITSDILNIWHKFNAATISANTTSNIYADSAASVGNICDALQLFSYFNWAAALLVVVYCCILIKIDNQRCLCCSLLRYFIQFNLYIYSFVYIFIFACFLLFFLPMTCIGAHRSNWRTPLCKMYDSAFALITVDCNWFVVICFCC